MADELVMDWAKAAAHLKEIEQEYASLTGRPGVNPYFALGSIAVLRGRFDSDDRSLNLYHEILELE